MSGAFTRLKRVWVHHHWNEASPVQHVMHLDILITILLLIPKVPDLVFILIQQAYVVMSLTGLVVPEYVGNQIVW
jgi:hypothetical protein